MSERESEFIKEIKLVILRGILGFLGLILLGGTVFYFNTTYRMNSLEIITEKLDKEKADKALMELKLESIDKSLGRIEQKLDEK